MEERTLNTVLAGQAILMMDRKTVGDQAMYMLPPHFYPYWCMFPPNDNNISKTQLKKDNPPDPAGIRKHLSDLLITPRTFDHYRYNCNTIDAILQRIGHTWWRFRLSQYTHTSANNK